MLKDRCCRLSVMNILLRLSPLELFNSIFLNKIKKGGGGGRQGIKIQTTKKEHFFLELSWSAVRSSETGFGKPSAIFAVTG